MLNLKTFQTKLAEINRKSNSIVLIEKANALSLCKILKSELSLLKKEINLDIKQIRAEYSKKMAEASNNSHLITGFFLGKKVANSKRASNKRDLNIEKNQVIAPYEKLKLDIDKLLIKLEKDKQTVETRPNNKSIQDILKRTRTKNDYEYLKSAARGLRSAFNKIEKDKLKK